MKLMMLAEQRIEARRARHHSQQPHMAALRDPYRA